MIDYKLGDEIWWFKVSPNTQTGFSSNFRPNLSPGELHLIHDQIREIHDDVLVCWHCAKNKDEVWGKSRQEAWDTLKDSIEKWGELE